MTKDEVLKELSQMGSASTKKVSLPSLRQRQAPSCPAARDTTSTRSATRYAL